MQEWLDEIRDLLDTEMKAVLCPDPPDKLIAIGTESYSLLLLNKGSDERRTDAVAAAIRKHGNDGQSGYPFIIARQLNLDDAIAGQLALVCCDCVSAFVRDELVEERTREVFRELYCEVMNSREFQLVDVRVNHFPQTDLGRRFCWQFFGLASGIACPATFRMYRKKARLLTLWSKELNADIVSNEV
jgi:hypothetical protein